MTTISFACQQFPPAIIRYAVWLDVRFTLRLRSHGAGAIVFTQVVAIVMCAAGG